MTNNDFINRSLDQLKRAVAIREDIEALEKELQQVMSADSASGGVSARSKKRTMSPEAKAKTSASRKALFTGRRTTGAAKAPNEPLGEAQKKAQRSANLAKARKARWDKYRAAKKA